MLEFLVTLITMYSINLIYLVIKFNFYNCSFLVFFVSQYVNELFHSRPLKNISQFPRKAGANIKGFFNKTIKNPAYFFLFFRIKS